MIFFANPLNKLFQESVWRIILRKYILGFKELIPGGWESLIKVTGLLFGRFKLNTQGRPMWVWLKLQVFFVPELANIVTFHSKHQTKICNLHPKARRRASRHIYIGVLNDLNCGLQWRRQLPAVCFFSPSFQIKRIEGRVVAEISSSC